MAEGLQSKAENTLQRHSSTRRDSAAPERVTQKPEGLMQSFRGSARVSVKQQEKQFNISISEQGRLTRKVTQLLEEVMQFQHRAWTSHRYPALGTALSSVGFDHLVVGFAKIFVSGSKYFCQA